MKNIIEYLRSRIFIVNLVLAILFMGLMFGFTYKWLSSYTNHGESISVPDLRGLTFEQVDEYLKDKNLRFVIVDSTVYDVSKTPGTVIEQEPSPDSKVKENRTIYLSVTRTVPPRIKVPNLVDVSLKQAEEILKTYGFRVGDLIYKPDLAKNAVLAMLNKGRTLSLDDILPKGSVIDLVLGDGFGNTRVPIPSLMNLTRGEALFVLKASSLNIGSTVYDESVRDTLMAKVYRQNPSYSALDSVSQGEAIDLFFTQNEDKIKLFQSNE